MEQIFSLLNVYLPVADVTVNLVALIAIGVSTGLLAGMFGLGGGLIIVPMLAFMGIDYPVAAASSTNQMTASSISGFMAYARRKRVDYKLGIIMLIGGVAGSIFGVKLFYRLYAIGMLDFVVAVCFVVVLGLIGTWTFADAAVLLYRKINKIETPRVRKIGWPKALYMPWRISFYSCHEDVSIISLVLVGFVGGVLVSIMGIGGSLIMIPIMVYILKVSDVFTAGTTHFQIIFTTILSTLLHAYSGQHLDIILSSILMVCTALGAQIGVKLSSGFHPDNFRILLALLVLVICVKVLYGAMSMPNEMFSIEVVSK